MNRDHSTEPPICDNDGNTVNPGQPDYGYWRGLHAAQAKWEAAMRRPSTNPAITAMRQRLLARQQVWNNVALDIAVGAVSPRALHELRKALKLAVASSQEGGVYLQEQCEGPTLRRSIEAAGLDYDTAMNDAYAEACAVDAERLNSDRNEQQKEH